MKWLDYVNEASKDISRVGGFSLECWGVAALAPNVRRAFQKVWNRCYCNVPVGTLPSPLRLFGVDGEASSVCPGYPIVLLQTAVWPAAYISPIDRALSGVGWVRTDWHRLSVSSLYLGISTSEVSVPSLPLIISSSLGDETWFQDQELYCQQKILKQIWHMWFRSLTFLMCHLLFSLFTVMCLTRCT